MTILRDAVCDAGYAAACNASLSMTLQSLTKSVNLVGRDWLQVATALPREYYYYSLLRHIRQHTQIQLKYKKRRS